MQDLPPPRPQPPASPAPKKAAGTASPPPRLTAALIQSRLSTDPSWKEAIFLECISKKQLTGLAQLFLEMFNRSSSGRECLTDGIEQILFSAPHTARSLSRDGLAFAFTPCPGPPTTLASPPPPQLKLCTQPALHQSRIWRAASRLSLLAAPPCLSCAARTIAA